MNQILNLQNTSFNIYEADVTPQSAQVHSHNNYELNYVKSGWGKRFVGDFFSSYESGDLVLLGPNLPHCWEGDISEGNDYPKNIAIRFSENFFDDILTRFPELKPAFNLFKEAAPGIHFKGPFVKNISIELENLLRSTGIDSISRLLKILDLLTRIKDRQYLSSVGYLEHNSQSDFKRMNKVYEYIFLNFQNPITLEEVSSLVFMTPKAFCRYFKQKTGNTLFETIKKVRISYACKLLKSSSKTIPDIAFLSGYSTLVHFYSQFKEMEHFTPAEYREKDF